MAKSTPQKEILVCGHPAAERIIQSILPRLDGALSVRGAHTKDELLEELARGRQSVCVIEHQVPGIDPMKQLAQLFEAGDDDDAVAALASKTQLSFSPGVTAYDLLPELVSRSPTSQFVITSHTRGSGLSPQQRALYKERKEVVKVMGFVNAQENSNYLLKLLSRVYLGKTWKPKSDP